MSIKSGYGNMDWVLALKANKAKPDYEAQVNGPEVIENALERTLEASFGTQTSEETAEQAMRRASKDAVNASYAAQALAACYDIKKKLALREIDPVALGVASDADWKNATDPSWVEGVAKLAAVAYQKRQTRAWDTKETVGNPTGSFAYDPQTSKDGRIMSAAGAGDDSRGRSMNVPANANSIFDPFKLDRFAGEENAHDASIIAKRNEAKSREAKHAEEFKAQSAETPGRLVSGNQVLPSGGKDSEHFAHRVPKDQVSMIDDLSKKLSELFTRVEDPRATTVAHNAERRESIQRKAEAKDKSWDTVENLKPKTTSELTERLMKLWEPKE